MRASPVRGRHCAVDMDMDTAMDTVMVMDMDMDSRRTVDSRHTSAAGRRSRHRCL